MAIAGAAPGWRLPAVAGAAFTVCAIAVRMTGRAPSVPADLLVFVVLSLPLTLTILCWEWRLGAPRRWIAVAGGVAAVIVILVNRSPVWWLPIAAASVYVTRPQMTRAAVERAAIAAITAILGYSAVWNANVLAGRLAGDRLIDGWLRAADAFVYRGVHLTAAGYDQIFPLIRTPWLLHAMNDAYLLIVPEVFLAILLTAWRDQALADRLLRTIFSAYALGLLVFLIAPAVGPCIAFPESISRAALPAQTDAVMRAMADGFRDVAEGADRPVIAYFVALPSLHVIIALVLQWHLRPFRFAAALFAPINALVVCSTVVLGYHYLADVAASIIIAPAMLAVFDPAFRQRWLPRSAGGQPIGETAVARAT